IYYLYCDYKQLGTTVNIKINDMVSSGEINVSDPIFINTKAYFEKDLYPRIFKKEAEIESYLEGGNKNKTSGDFSKRYLNIYGFMNMVNDFEETIKTVVVESPPPMSAQLQTKDLEKRATIDKKRKIQEDMQTEQMKKIKQGVLQQRTGLVPNEIPMFTNKLPLGFAASSGGAKSKKRIHRKLNKTRKYQRKPK
ncbi:MAG: hypothetical protein EBS86_12325, partial [Crocinitomicaceae bacterium]|nr:hypothetical protein [Crocinitomicaceae bacterium]